LVIHVFLVGLMSAMGTYRVNEVHTQNVLLVNIEIGTFPLRLQISKSLHTSERTERCPESPSLINKNKPLTMSL
jgi:hypothetical protein